jgi:N-acetyl-beta-hexosaminidase
MPSVQASIEYLQRLPRYEKEKPYWCFFPPREGFDPDVQRVDNLEWEAHSNIAIKDIRESKNEFKIDDCGFEVFDHESKFEKFEKAEDVTDYKLETERLLKEEMKAVYVKCYDSRLRKNVPFQRTCLDLNDPLLMEGPARGAHNGKRRARTSFKL